jgi:hypothetical protein
MYLYLVKLINKFTFYSLQQHIHTSVLTNFVWDAKCTRFVQVMNYISDNAYEETEFSHSVRKQNTSAVNHPLRVHTCEQSPVESNPV